MRNKPKVPHHHGYGEVGLSRYFALYLAMAGWAALGVYLFAHAFWPSTCQPDSVIEVYQCSGQLATGRSWVESTLMTWLWSTPLLVALEIMRHVNKWQRR